MLEELNIRNYALIDSISIFFEDGFNVLTGETGAGKSIIVGSLSFLMGAKADTDVIRTGTEEASVTAVIAIGAKSGGEVLEWLRVRDISPEDGRIIVRRNIKTSGRSSIYIQDVPVTRTDLAEFMALIFDIHGQHNHESLLRKESHRRYLDRFAGLEEEAAQFNSVFLELAEKKRTLENIFASERDRAERLEILSYAVEEIDKAAPRSGESRELESEAQRLGDFERLAEQANSAAAALYDGETSALSLCRRARNALDAAAAIDTSLAGIQKRLDDLYFEAEDISDEFRSYRDNLTYDPERLEEVEERLALLYRLKKKYAGGKGGGIPGGNSTLGSDEDAILAYRAQAAEEIEALSGAGENREKLRSDIAALEKDIASRAASIRARRKAGALKLGERITEILSHLGMPNARFSAAVLPKGQSPGQGPGALVCGPWGAEDVEFLISANTGEPLKDLSRIASGGELSRVMLAIKTVLSDANATGADVSPETLVFDEIDAGIGGEVALAVGEYLVKIGLLKQIFCVTHLASIAVRADNHLRVEKKVIGGGDGERTLTQVSTLGSEERRQEIARMLAGDAGKAALAHADDLLSKYGKGK
ncbi:DNA repair protein RecN [Spirochaetia bacterium]|nr:DNA repair protein RecN [Spirochaetia bacterium]